MGPGHSQVADLLPGLTSWIPREHRGEALSCLSVRAACDVEDIVDHGGSWIIPGCWKFSTLHPYPDKRGASGVDGHLVAQEL